MDATRFDAVARLFASRRLSRRSALAGAGLAVGAAVVNGAGTAAAQDATPAATPEVATSPALDKPPAQLFVQSFQSGSIAPSTSEFGTHTVTLEQGLGQTIVFTDRPSREVFTTPTPAFLDGLGFESDNPPNAAIVMEIGDGETDIAVVELFNPTYDDATHTATYDVTVLANWEDELELGFHEAPTDLSNLATSFGATHLFIDECSTAKLYCLRGGAIVGQIDDVYKTFWFSEFTCVPTAPNPQSIGDVYRYWEGQCNELITACEGQCNDIWY